MQSMQQVLEGGMGKQYILSQHLQALMQLLCMMRKGQGLLPDEGVTSLKSPMTGGS